MSEYCNSMLRPIFALTILAASAGASGQVPDRVPLLDDTRFEHGLTVWSPVPGKHVKQGELRPADGSGEPVWGLAQWDSRFTLAHAKPERLPSGAVRFFDGAKFVVFGTPSSDEADIILALNGQTEYRNKIPSPGDPWPHLLVERPLRHHPALVDLAAVPFQIRYRVLYSKATEATGWDERLHTAQFVFYLTVQNHNRNSPGGGDYLWVGMMLYDGRHRLPAAYGARDAGSSKKQGTGKFIYRPAFKRLSNNSPHDGDWITVDVDLLPMLREALQTAWQRGYLTDSNEATDYRLGVMNMGWEITGPIDAAVQVRGLKLEAILKPSGLFRGEKPG